MREPRKFEQMNKYIPEGKQGIARIQHVSLSKDKPRFVQPKDYVRPGDYVHLYVRGQLMMSDTDMEHRTNFEFVNKAEGDVLVAGLGIGYVLLPVLRAPEVTSVTVIELHQDVIDLVEPHLRVAVGADASKLTVVRADIFDFEPTKGQKWDVVYFDIWAERCADNLEEMTKLHKRFARRKRVWMDSWYRDALMREKRAWDRERADYTALAKILNKGSG